MNKSDLVKKIFDRTNGLDNKDIDEALRELFKFLSNSLKENNRIELRGFGSFSMRRRPMRLGRNPKTNQSINIESKSYTYFRASKNLKSDLNK